MARDQTRNIEAFKIGGTRVNEFEFHKNQGRMTEQFGQHAGDKASGAKPATKAERVAELMAEAHRKVEKRRKHEAAKAGISKRSAAPESDRKGSAAKAGVSKQSAATGSDRKGLAKGQTKRPVSTASGAKKAASKRSRADRKSQTRGPQQGGPAAVTKSAKKT